MIYQLLIPNWVPQKKNLLQFNPRTGARFYPTEVKQRITEIAEEVACQWHPRAPLVHPAIAMVFYTKTERSDRDNTFTTLLDSLVGGGVLKEDSIAFCNGEMLIGKAYKADFSATRIFIESEGDFNKLYRELRTLNLDDLESTRDALPKQTKRAKKGGFKRAT